MSGGGPGTAKPVATKFYQHSSENLQVDIPRLAFGSRSRVDAVLGKPWRVRRDSNGKSWSEGAIFLVEYRQAECGFLAGHLTSIVYKFKRTPKSVGIALEWAGISNRAAFLDREHPNSFPFRAGIDTGDAIQFEDLTLRLVLVGEEDILVNFANVNTRYADWPIEVRSAWLRAGAKPLD